MKRHLLAAILILVPGLAHAADTRPNRPHWSLELKGGAFIPDTANWSRFYGSSYMGEYGGALSYKIHRRMEIGLEGSYTRATGKGSVHGNDPENRVQAGQVTYEQAPVNLFVLARGVFRENQWLVPYAGGGWTRMFYRQEVKGQARTRGSVNGYHARAGVQLLLDGLETDAANDFYVDYGVHHTYLFLEARYTRATAVSIPEGSVNLGGVSCLGGFLFEF